MDYPSVTPSPLRKCKLCNVRGMNIGCQEKKSDGKKKEQSRVVKKVIT